LTPFALAAMLAAMLISAVLAWGGLIWTLIILCGVGLVVLTIISILKMRKDDFWDKTEY